MKTKNFYFAGKYDSIFRFCLGMISFALFCLIVFSCDTTEPGNNKVDLNPKLHSVFYWGIKDPTTLIPNTGVSVGPSILFPTWTVNKKIFFYSSELINNIYKKGIFEIEINPNDYSLINNEYKLYEYDFNILNILNVSSTGEILLLVLKNGNSVPIIAQLEGNYLVEKEILLDISWNVKGISIWNHKEGFIFYGQDPQNNITGFYSLLKNTNNEYETKRILAIDDPGLNKTNFITSYDGENLFFGLNESELNSNGTMQLLKLSLTEEGEMPIVILERKGGYIDVAQNPVNQGLFLVNYFFGGNSLVEPQGHIELFDSATLQSVDLNIRTHIWLNRFIINEHPSWSPDGKHFTFSAGAFDGEGGRYDLELWIYEDVP